MELNLCFDHYNSYKMNKIECLPRFLGNIDTYTSYIITMFL